MRGREISKVPPADLMVCFPPRAHLSLLPKSICSPARPADQPSTRHQYHHRRGHYRRKSSHASPLLWAKTNAAQNSDESSEPTSPKVTCAGQIKVRPKPNAACKNWQSVMEEIERIHNNKKKKKSAWIESLGFKKEVMQFLTCLRNISFDFRCFGAFPAAAITSDDDDSDDGEDDDEKNYRKSGSKEEKSGYNGEEIERNSGDVFSKWFMILQENQGKEYFAKDEHNGKTVTPCLADDDEEEEDDDGDANPIRPPPNALLLMRCRSAPAKERLEADGRQSMVVMNYESEFSGISGEIAKETWIEGGIRDLLSRSRSWRR